MIFSDPACHINPTGRQREAHKMNNESDGNNNDFFYLQTSVAVQSQRFFGLPPVRTPNSESEAVDNTSQPRKIRRASALCREIELTAP